MFDPSRSSLQDRINDPSLAISVFEVVEMVPIYLGAKLWNYVQDCENAKHRNGPELNIKFHTVDSLSLKIGFQNMGVVH